MFKKARKFLILVKFVNLKIVIINVVIIYHLKMECLLGKLWLSPGCFQRPDNSERDKLSFATDTVLFRTEVTTWRTWSEPEPECNRSVFASSS